MKKNFETLLSAFQAAHKIQKRLYFNYKHDNVTYPNSILVESISDNTIVGELQHYKGTYCSCNLMTEIDVNNVVEIMEESISKFFNFLSQI